MKAIIAALALLASLLPGVALASDMTADDGGGAGAWDGQILVTGYQWTGRATASGVWPYVGSAACPQSFAFGQRVQLTGKVDLTVTCMDRYQQGLSDRIDVFVRYSREAFGLTGQYAYRLLEDGQ